MENATVELSVGRKVMGEDYSRLKFPKMMTTMSHMPFLLEASDALLREQGVSVPFPLFPYL